MYWCIAMKRIKKEELAETATERKVFYWEDASPVIAIIENRQIVAAEWLDECWKAAPSDDSVR